MNAFPPDSPPVFCPLTPVAYPPTEELISATAEWLGGVSPGRTPEETYLHAVIGAGMTTRFLPEAPPHGLLSMSKYAAWSFQLDDEIDSGRMGGAAEVASVVLALARIVEVPQAALLGDLPTAVAFAEFAADLRSWATPIQMAHFATGFSLWMRGFVWEVALRERGIRPTLNEYLAVRVQCAGSANAIDMGMMCLGLELPEHQWTDPAVIALRESAMAVAVLDNDRYSRAKEDQGGEESLDVFSVILQENPHYTFPQAATEGIALRDRIMALYLKLSEQLRRTNDPGLHTYVHAADLLITGNLDFGATSLRYTNPDSPAAATARTDKPSDPNPAPVDVPTFAWWWDTLQRPRQAPQPAGQPPTPRSRPWPADRP
ncbi:terpene synthase family protein [Streptomyces caniferus]|uniref:terpene synthase family protein n=1 Tax=Streptomyces caniferus TaxID=285557 RepID=UPI002E2D9EFC|nr:terpene synthase family protein [Streptomyces caniferus]